MNQTVRVVERFDEHARISQSRDDSQDLVTEMEQTIDPGVS